MFDPGETHTRHYVRIVCVVLLEGDDCPYLYMCMLVMWRQWYIKIDLK